MDALEALKQSVHTNLNVPGLVNDIVDQIAEPALLAAVAKTDTKIDDVLVAAILPQLKIEIKTLVKDQFDKLFA